MSIRAKIFTLAGTLLVLFGIVVGTLSVLQAATAHRLEDIVAHHEALRRILGDVDVETDEYELRVDRLLLQSGASGDPAEMQAAVAKIEPVGNRIREEFEKLGTVLASAVAYNHDNPDDLEELARVQGELPLIARQVDPFVALGKEVTDAALAGRLEEARALSRRFVAFEQAFGPDLAQIRHSVGTLTERAVARIYAHQRVNAWLSFGLFAVASVVGLGISGVGSARVVAALHKLLASTRAVEAGRTDLTVPVLTRDEVGELARAFNHMLAELHQRERIQDTFGTFIDPRIVNRLISASEGTNDTAERKVATIFFSDIQGFSAISEQLTAAAMVNLLNAYFTAVAEQIRRHNGIIDKYIGDAVMAFWCVPFSAGDEHALDGCKAALAQIAAIAEMRQRLPDLTGLRRNAPDLVVRMGIATGDVVVGTIGSPHARSFTVIGDMVNIASRLEGVNKLYGTSVLIAEDTYRLAQHGIEARELDIVTVSGKSEPVRIYELMAEAGGLDATRIELRQAFAEGLEAYRQEDWSKAEERFEACRRLVPDDGPTAVYLKRLAQQRDDPTPDGRDGVVRLTKK
jgi:adenylate cyclase